MGSAEQDSVLHREIVDNARAATGSRLVTLGWLDRDSGTVRVGAMSGMDTPALQRALAVIRSFVPGFDPSGIVTPVQSNPVNRAVFLEARSVQVPFHEAAGATMPPAALRVASRVVGLRFTFVCPLVVSGEVVGSMAFHVDRPLPESQQRTCAAFARQAALTVENARLRDTAERAHAQLVSVFEAAREAIVVLDAAGRVVATNAAARDWAVHLGSASPGVVLPGADVLPPTRIGQALLATASRALSAEVPDQEIVVADSPLARRLHVSTAAIRDPAGRVVGAVVAARDVTALWESAAARARLDGAIKTVRRVCHELGNQLAPVLAYADLITDAPESDFREYAGYLRDGVLRAAVTLDQLGRIVRYAETEFGGEVMLDLEASTDRRQGDAEEGAPTERAGCA